MTEENQPQEPARESRTSLLSPFLILFLVILVGGAGVALYLRTKVPEKKSEAGGFDIAELPVDKPDPVRAPAVLAAPDPQAGASSLSMVSGAPDAGMQMGSGEPPPAQGKSSRPSDFVSAVRKSEGKMNALAEAYTKRYPVIAKYGDDWMKAPDLKKLNDDYMEDHDPVKFMRGLARSKSFAPLVKKYATEKAVQSFVVDAVKNAPSDVMSAATAYMKQDPLVKNLVSSVISALGLPPGLLGGADGGKKVGEGEVMDSLMKSNPALQQMLQQQSGDKRQGDKRQ